MLLVMRTRPTDSSSSNTRLKVLKEEIRKPYFIKLKRFLWEQGVKTVNESAKSLKIYPARKSSQPTRTVATFI